MVRKHHSAALPDFDFEIKTVNGHKSLVFTTNNGFSIVDGKIVNEDMMHNYLRFKIAENNINVQDGAINGINDYIEHAFYLDPKKPQKDIQSRADKLVTAIENASREDLETFVRNYDKQVKGTVISGSNDLKSRPATERDFNKLTSTDNPATNQQLVDQPTAKQQVVDKPAAMAVEKTTDPTVDIKGLGKNLAFNKDEKGPVDKMIDAVGRFNSFRNQNKATKDLIEELSQAKNNNMLTEYVSKNPNLAHDMIRVFKRDPNHSEVTRGWIEELEKDLKDAEKSKTIQKQ